MFLENFEKLCKKKGVSPTSALLEMGLSNATYSNWKKRGSTPQGKNLQTIANYFGVSVSSLLAEASKESESGADFSKPRALSPAVVSLSEKISELSTLPGGELKISELEESVDAMLERLKSMQTRMAELEELKAKVHQMEQELAQDNSANTKK